MNLRDLRYAVAVADRGHFGRAAIACHVSQPTLSGQILKLEDELQVKIFERMGKTVRPTRIGNEILALARQAIAAANDIEATALASRDPLAGPIRFGIIPTLAPYLMAGVLSKAASALPAAPLILVEDMTHHLLQQLSDGDLDAALIATDPMDDRLTTIAVFDDPFLIAMAPDHPLSAQEAVLIDDIERETLLLLSDGHCLRDQAIDLCGNVDWETPHTDVRASSLETLLHLAAAGYGVTLIPKLAWDARESASSRLVVRPLADAGAKRRVRMVWRRGLPRQAAAEALTRVVRESAPASVERIEDKAA
jgi:LysR family hydrogen peroxide-inducible transcriptional activator